MTPKQYVRKTAMSSTVSATNKFEASSTASEGESQGQGNDCGVIDEISPAPFAAPVTCVEEPPAKVAKEQEATGSKEAPVKTGKQPGSWQRHKADTMRKVLEEQRAKHFEWEASVAKDYGIDPSEIGAEQGEKEKKVPRFKACGQEYPVLPRKSTAYGAAADYRPYAPGDVVLDFNTNAKCKAVLAQGKSRDLPTLSLPILSGVQNCCKFNLVEFTTPSFPRNLPPLNQIKHVLCFDVMNANAKDHSNTWRFMDQVTHRQSVNWIRCGRRMTREERTTVICLKDFKNKLLCKFATFLRIEEGKSIRGC